jgi:hypothetical protein
MFSLERASLSRRAQSACVRGRPCATYDSTHVRPSAPPPTPCTRRRGGPAARTTGSGDRRCPVRSECAERTCGIAHRVAPTPRVRAGPPRRLRALSVPVDWRQSADRAVDVARHHRVWRTACRSGCRCTAGDPRSPSSHARAAGARHVGGVACRRHSPRRRRPSHSSEARRGAVAPRIGLGKHVAHLVGTAGRGALVMTPLRYRS